MLQAIVFDFDGVIVDSEPLHYRAFLHVARTLGLAFSYEEYLRDYVGFDDRDAFREMLKKSRGPGAPLAELCRRKGEAFEAIVHEGIDPIPGTRELIGEATAAGWPIAIASGATRADIDLILGKLGLADRFRTIVTADDVARSKPDPQTYRLAVERLNLPAKQCLSIEDTAAGVESARGAGLMTLGLSTLGKPALLRRAHRVVDTLRGVNLATLRSWFE